MSVFKAIRSIVFRLHKDERREEPWLDLEACIPFVI